MMGLSPERIQAVRRALESTYGLSLQGVGESQLLLALVENGKVLDHSEPKSLERIVDRLPIDESWLFRDDDLWTWLEGELGPSILKRAMDEGRPVRALSLGCSSGQEVFSLAMMFLGLLERAGVAPSASPAYVEIQGVDSSPGRIVQARAGRLNRWSVERCRGDRRGRVTLEDPVVGWYRVDDRVRALCRFEVGNLLDMTQREGGLDRYDLILCRHVLIYFSSEGALDAAERLSRGMKDGSVLVFAAAEAHLLAQARLTRLGHLGAARVALSSAGKELVGADPRSFPKRRPRPRKAPKALLSQLERSSSWGIGSPPREDPADRHIRNALAHSRDGRSVEAVQEARAALFLDPCDLFSRFILGKELVAVDVARGRKVLEELLDHVTRLPPEREIPSVPGLSAGQIAAATRLLLGEAS